MSTAENKGILQNHVVLVLLLFIFPPLGIYAVVKRNSETWKKVVYSIAGVFASFVLFIFTLSLFISNGEIYYSNGESALKKGEYNNAIEEFNKIEEDDENYGLAQKKIASIQNSLDSISLQQEQMKLVKEEEQKKNLSMLFEFQKKWADSVVKVEGRRGNRHLVASKLILPDTILFEYTESVTRNGYEVNLKNDKALYSKWYQNDLKENLGANFPIKEVFISCIPNSNIDYDEVLAKRKARTERADKIRTQFSVWDGSHSKLKRLVKNNMKDPSSFDHVETNYADTGSYVLIQMRYRGKNSFGALVIETINAKADLEGNIFEIE